VEGLLELSSQSPLVEVNASTTPKTVAFYTLGCKTNQLESATLAHQFIDHGWQVRPFEDGADLVVINTCTVTERADTEAKRIIRRARLHQPDARIAVTGCYAQVAPDELAALDGVSFVLGNGFKDQLASIIHNTPPSAKPMVKVSELDKSRMLSGASTSGLMNGDQERTRASLKIQDGCDFKCTYCIIWEARGPSRCLPVEDLCQQLQGLLDEGFKEIVLTGINIGQYWDETHPDGLPYQAPRDFSDLLTALIALPGDFRLRLSSLDPVEVTDKLIAVMATSNGKICPHVHLSAQSAHDGVLKRMARRHHVAEFEAICYKLVAQIPNVSIGSDIIVGFPGETDEAFEQTYQVLRDTPIHYFHVFSYSKRKGTPAASFPDQVPQRSIKERAHRLTALGEAKWLAFRTQSVGQSVRVLTEHPAEAETPVFSGMSANYMKVTFLAEPSQLRMANEWVTATISSVTDKQTWATNVVTDEAPLFVANEILV
jgi:threonylcarbamoyladenosine tRNA methylthiotransferase MtaB